ncbi:MAG: 30S ribosomal protein S17 [Anaerolineae bacterium]
MPGKRRVLNGRVVSTKMQKTVVVEVESTMQHRLYKKVMRSVKKYLAHDEEQTCGDGDLVRIEETRPLSHRKRWQVVEIVRRAGA